MKRIWALALAGLAVAAASSPAKADPWGWHRHHAYWGPPPVVYGWGPPMVVYQAPPPVVVYAPPPGVVYAPPPMQAVQATPASPPFTDATGRYCREYQTSLMVGGQPQQGYGTACLQPDGTWRTVN